MDWKTFIRAMTALSRTNLKRFNEQFLGPDGTALPELPSIDNLLLRESLSYDSPREMP